MSLLAKKLLGIGAGVAVLGVLIGLYVASWATSFPKAVAAISLRTQAGFSGTQLTLQTVAAIGPKYSPSHPDWVSYLVLSHGQWVHSTIYRVPANSIVHVTIYQYDGDSGLRNPFLSAVQGTVGGTETIDGKPVTHINPEEASHTFVVPQLGIFVPLPGVPEEAKNQCAFAPCAISEAHHTITFTIHTGKKGRYRWQCFVPCAAGFIDGFGGPMQTLGYMDGFLDVGLEMAEPNHARRFGLLWLISSVIATPLVVVLLGPILPPGNGSEQASGHVTDNTVLIAMATPVLLMVVLFLVYAIVFFRQPKGAVLEGPAVRGDARIQMAWIVVTSVLVLALAVYGTVRLLGDGAGSGGGPSPVAVPSGPKLPVQVIAQQWAFTYRYPTYGGVETTHLVLPVDQMVELHVTSIDVIHSFWSYQLGVKADANPNTDNIVFVKPTHIEGFDVRCAELCGIWHGYMFDRGHVVSESDFQAWISEQRKRFAPIQKVLPAYSTKYTPEPTRRAE